MQSQKTVGVGLIGFGSRLQGLVKTLLASHPHIAVRAVFDPSPGAVVQARKSIGSGIRVYDDYGALVKDGGIEWVMIGSWNSAHAEQAIAALDAGKHVFCEKPLATHLEDCLRVRDAVNRSSKNFAFGLVLRYSPHYRKVRHYIDEGVLGQLISFEFNETLAYHHGGYIFGNWRRYTKNAGSFVLEKCCHDLDLANWMSGSLPVRVASFGGRRVFAPANASLKKAVGTTAEGRSRYQTWNDPQAVDPFSGGADVNDHQVMILHYANGACATFHINAHAASNEWRFYLVGTRGSIRADAVSGHLEVTRIGDSAPLSTGSDSTLNGHEDADQVLIEHLGKTMLEDLPPLAGIGEALRACVVAFGIDEAQRTGQVIDLRPLWIQAGIDLAQ
jgi:predicted dehydrogenase